MVKKLEVSIERAQEVIDTLKKELAVARELLDDVDSNDVHTQGIVAQRITKLVNQIEALETFIERLEEK